MSCRRNKEIQPRFSRPWQRKSFCSSWMGAERMSGRITAQTLMIPSCKKQPLRWLEGGEERRATKGEEGWRGDCRLRWTRVKCASNRRFGRWDPSWCPWSNGSRARELWYGSGDGACLRSYRNAESWKSDKKMGRNTCRNDHSTGSTSEWLEMNLPSSRMHNNRRYGCYRQIHRENPNTHSPISSEHPVSGSNRCKILAHKYGNGDDVESP